jgi:4-amino-4-deoxy-L-arabinose transferase-like glycosyltransferase
MTRPPHEHDHVIPVAAAGQEPGTEPAWLGAAGPAIVASAGLTMLAWSWGTWPDPVIDFGREIYVPWQLAEGKVLYRDIASYFNGPLSPYMHALLFGLFGTSLRTLVVFNLVLVAMLVGMLYWLIAQSAGRLAATAAGVAFFVLFAFGQFLVTGNYNYVCPYSYELPHGITLTVAGIACLVMWSRSGRGRWLAACGGMLGLVLLTKAEVSLAATVCLLVGLVATLYVRPMPIARGVAIFFAGAALPPLLAFGLLCLRLSPSQALGGMLGAWRFIGHRELTDLPYFRELAGTADIAQSLNAISTWTGGYLALFASAAAAGYLMNRHAWQVRWVSSGVFIAVVVLGLWSWTGINWNNFIRPAPLILLVLLLVLVILLSRRRDHRLILPLVLVTWALVMLAKMPLNAHIFHYGFALAMPATLIMLAAFVGWLPALLERAGRSGWPLRAAVLAALVVTMYAHGRALDLFWSRKIHTVGSGGDRFHADERGTVINALVNELTSAPASDTLLMVPEGLLANYLSRRVNPTGQLNFTPPALIMYGESTMMEALVSNPPDWIGLVDVDTTEYGARSFGIDYAREVGEWIASNYDVVKVFRSSRSPTAFEVRLLRRRPDQS